jgi:hypothetical protein
VIAQDCLAGFDIAGQRRIDPSTQERFAECGIVRYPALRERLESFCHGHVRLLIARGRRRRTHGDGLPILQSSLANEAEDRNQPGS